MSYSTTYEIDPDRFRLWMRQNKLKAVALSHLLGYAPSYISQCTRLRRVGYDAMKQLETKFGLSYADVKPLRDGEGAEPSTLFTASVSTSCRSVRLTVYDRDKLQTQVFARMDGYTPDDFFNAIKRAADTAATLYNQNKLKENFKDGN